MTLSREVARQRGGRRRSESAQPRESPALMPLDFALSFMRDGTKPDALRVSTAKLAAALLPKPAAEEAAPPEDDTAALAAKAQNWSSFEIARRIAHILARRHDELRRAELIARGYDVEKNGLPMDNSDWPAFLKRIQDSL